VEVGVTDLGVALDFYTSIWGLTQVAGANGVHYLRATGPFHHVLSLRRQPQAGLVRIVFDAGSRATVDGLHARLAALGVAPLEAPRGLDRPGGGYGFGFKDGEARNFAVICDVADHRESGDDPDRPRKLSHVNLNAAANEATTRILTDGLGFRLSDYNDKFRFLRCNRDHHSIVVGFNDSATLNHIAFEMSDLDGVMRGAGRMRDHGYPIEWGPGRHGPGRNVFCYFCGPEELPLEYTAEMEQVDETYRTGTPADWKWPPRRVDRWGVSDPPSRRVLRAQSLFLFTPDGYRMGA
jgi:catechol 2,3-dioxygenase-like lactoylglutathione lyase family enzyme